MENLYNKSPINEFNIRNLLEINSKIPQNEFIETTKIKREHKQFQNIRKPLIITINIK